MNDTLHETHKESVDVFEKFSIKPLLYLSIIITLVIYAISFYPVYFILKPKIIGVLPFSFNYILLYLALWVVVFTVFGFYYKNRAANMSDFVGNFKFLRQNPKTFVARTGVRLIDIVGVVFATFFAITSSLFEPLHFLIPFFILSGLSFLFALITGSSKQWNLKRR